MKHIFLKTLLLGTMLLPISAVGQHAFVVNAPTVVEVNETFRVIFTATGKAKNFIQPQISDFEVLAGPTFSTMSSTNIINGKRTHSIEESYTYILRASKEGKFSISSATVEIEGKSYSSTPVTIEVVKGGATSSQGDASKGKTQGISESDIILKLDVSKNRVVKGEAVIATLKLYTKLNISAFEDIKFPTFDGFWSQEIDTPTSIEFVRETLNGQIYNAALLRRYMLLPQQSGEITIEPAEMSCLYQVRTTSASRSIFDDFFDSGYQTLRKRVYTDKVKINVSNLPSPAPASFTGGVGDFKMTAKISRDSLTAHEAASLIVTISGTGNINLIEAPTISFPPDFEVYDVKRGEKITSGTSGVSGTKTFEFPFIPRSPGSFEMAPVNFTYYNIKQKRYITLISQPLILNVARGAESDAIVVAGGVSKQIVKSLGEDIRFISTDFSTLKKNRKNLCVSPKFFVGLGIILSLFVAAWFVLKKRIKMRNDVAGSRNRKAKKVAKARLKKAESFLKENLHSAFYEELHKAVLGYISDKLTIPIADLNRENISDALLSKGNSEDVVKSFFDILDNCEYARYAPSSGFTAMENHYKDAIKVISEIES